MNDTITRDDNIIHYTRDQERAKKDTRTGFIATSLSSGTRGHIRDNTISLSVCSLPPDLHNQNGTKIEDRFNLTDRENKNSKSAHTHSNLQLLLSQAII